MAGGKHRLFIIVVCLLTVAVGVLTYRRVPLYTTFYGYEVKSSGTVGLKILLLSCVGLLTFATVHKTISAWKFLALGMAIGTVAQFAFAYTEGRGFEGIRGRAVAGHGQFIVAALAADDAVATVRDYESLADRGKLGQFARSKPPGTLLFYILTERISRLIVPHTYDERLRTDRFVDFLAIVWPFVATFAILPLYWLATLLAGAAEARVAVGLYLLVPSFNLVTEHTDQVLFPFLFVSVVALFVWCVQSRSSTMLMGRGLAAGAALWLAVFCDFPLAVAAVLWLGLWVAAFLTDRRAYRARIQTTALLAGALLAGVLVPSIVLWTALHYNPIVRWRSALAFHASWRNVPAVVGWDAGLSNVAEFIDWTGVPVVLLALAIFWLGRGDRGRSMPYMVLMASTICIVGYLAFFSRTVAEIARLWLFLMPVMCLVASRSVAVLRKTHRVAVPIFLALQFATVYLIKVSHDFW